MWDQRKGAYRPSGDFRAAPNQPFTIAEADVGGRASRRGWVQPRVTPAARVICCDQHHERMLGLPMHGYIRAPCMSKERDRAPLSTEISPPKSEVDLTPSVCWASGVEVERVHASVDAPAGDRLAIGQTISGRYRIERELGEGGMGVVYLATDEQVVGETFAIKVLKEPLRPEALSVMRGRCARRASSAIRTSSMCTR